MEETMEATEPEDMEELAQVWTLTIEILNLYSGLGRGGQSSVGSDRWRVGQGPSGS